MNTSQGPFLSPAEMMRKHGLAAKKSWGQCFLHERSVVERIVNEVAPKDDETVVEIGAGLGALTSLLSERAKKVLAIERDRDLVKVLKSELAQRPVEVIEANALTFDFSQFDPPVKVVGNLPYNISSPLLFRLIDHRRGVRSATLMFQKELAQRLTAAPGSRLYGAPTVTVEVFASVRTCMQVGRGAFLPAPRVDSTVIQLEMRQIPLSAHPKLCQRIVRAAFAARRKMLRKALESTFSRELVESALNKAGISPRVRAETLAAADFIALADAIGELDPTLVAP
jgi:16S rRNA (adenine1518-N6/adenine1519-N6)-dimethyltransferase